MPKPLEQRLKWGHLRHRYFRCVINIQLSIIRTGELANMRYIPKAFRNQVFNAPPVIPHLTAGSRNPAISRLSRSRGQAAE